MYYRGVGCGVWGGLEEWNTPRSGCRAVPLTWGGNHVALLLTDQRAGHGAQTVF